MYGLELNSDIDGSLLLSSNAVNLGFIGKATYCSVAAASSLPPGWFYDFYTVLSGHVYTEIFYGHIITYRIEHQSTIPPLIFSHGDYYGAALINTFYAAPYWYYQFSQMSPAYLRDGDLAGGGNRISNIDVFCFGFFNNMNRKTNYGMDLFGADGGLVYTTAAEKKLLTISHIFNIQSKVITDSRYTETEKSVALPTAYLGKICSFLANNTVTTGLVRHYSGYKFQEINRYYLTANLFSPDSAYYGRAYFGRQIYSQRVVGYSSNIIYAGYDKTVAAALIVNSDWE